MRQFLQSRRLWVFGVACITMVAAGPLIYWFLLGVSKSESFYLQRPTCY